MADATQNQTVCAGSPPTTSVCCIGTCCDGCCGVGDTCGACLVFVTNTPQFSANLSGLDRANALCQARAEAASRLGVYMAWLSASGQSSSTRFQQSQQPYHLVNGTLIADNWTDLTTNLPLAHESDVTEIGITGVFDAAWTHTTATGTEEATANSRGGWGC